MKRSNQTGSGRRAKKAPPTRPTIKDIAQQCGVHPSTVSRALSSASHHLVAEDVARRIRAAATALGYRPNITAAGLRTGRSGLIGVLAPDIADPSFPPILGGVAETLNATGYATIVVDVGPQGSQQELVQQLVARGVDGLVLASVKLRDPVIKHCIDMSIPVVLVSRTDAGRRLPAVVTDDEGGIRLAVEHLVALGHRRIGHVAGPPDVSTGALRRAGFAASTAHAGLSARETMIESTTAYTRLAGRSAALRLLAFGIYDALAALGLNCPNDVSVVGHNDMPYVDMLSPPLTSVRIAHREMGEQAARLLLERIAQPTNRRDHIVLKPALILRGSTAAPAR